MSQEGLDVDKVHAKLKAMMLMHEGQTENAAELLKSHGFTSDNIDDPFFMELNLDDDTENDD